MIALKRLLPLALGAVVLVLAVRGRWNNPDVLLDPRSLAMTVVIPWLVLALTDSVRSATDTLRDVFARRPADLPADQRAASISRIEFLAGASVAAGLIAAMMSLLTGLNEIASLSGSADASMWPKLTAGLLVGPVYGIAIKVLLYDPAATALASAGAGLEEVFDAT